MNRAQTGGVGFFGGLFLVLMTLKILGHLSISWVWVTAPLWAGLVASIVFAVAMVVIIYGAAALDRFIFDPRARRRNARRRAERDSQWRPT